MSGQTFLLHIGIVDFADPTLLLIGDAPGFQWLADRLEARQPIDLAVAGRSIRQVNVTLHIEPTDADGSLDRRGSVLHWAVSPSEAREFAGLLRSLAAAERPGHQYLDPASNHSGLQIVASKGEYDPATPFWL